MTRVRWKAATLILGMLSAFALIVVGVDHFEAQIRRINWALVSIMCAFVVAAIAIYRWNDQLRAYNLVDLFMNPKTGKPDPYRHLLFLFAFLTVWSIVQVVLAKEWSYLNALLLGALGFFVAKPTIDGISDAIAKRGAPDDDDPIPPGPTRRG